MLSFKECGIDTLTNLFELPYHVIITQFKIFEKYIERENAKMNKDMKNTNAKKPSKRK